MGGRCSHGWRECNNFDSLCLPCNCPLLARASKASSRSSQPPTTWWCCHVNVSFHDMGSPVAWGTYNYSSKSTSYECLQNKQCKCWSCGSYYGVLPGNWRCKMIAPWRDSCTLNWVGTWKPLETQTMFAAWYSPLQDLGAMLVKDNNSWKLAA